MKQINKLFKPILFFLFFLFTAFVLALSLRGIHGNPTTETLNSPAFKDEGPLELSPERGRFALTYSLAENKSFKFSLPVAKFVTPDLGYKDGYFVSLFAPGVSFLTIPGYLVGKFFGVSQVGTFAVVALFSALNVLLIVSISRQLGAYSLAASAAGLIFLFATPAYAYAVTLYQHHITVFLLLASLYFLIKWQKNLLSLVFVWFFIGLSISVDYPNFIMFLPLGLYSLLRFFDINKTEQYVKLKFKSLGMLTFIGLVIPLGVFLWTNKQSYGNPFQLAGTVRTVKEIDESGNLTFSPASQKEPGDPGYTEKTATGFFHSRNTIQGLSIHLFGKERGVLVYTPVMFLSVLGIIYLYKRKGKVVALLLSVVGANILLYSMWDDPWGGWAFGSRYLIPSYAILAIFLARALTELKRKFGFLLLFLLLSYYSISVNTLGALTTNKVPPRGEAIALEALSGKKENYTYFRNWDYLNNGGTKSFVYNIYANKYVTPFGFYAIISGVIAFVTTLEISLLYLTAKRNE